MKNSSADSVLHELGFVVIVVVEVEILRTR